MLPWIVQRQIRKRYQTLGYTLGIAGLTLGLQATGVLQLFEKAALDQFFRLRSATARPASASPVTLISISETDLQAMAQWPLSDAQLAKALNKIRQSNPAVIGLNLHRDFSVEPGQAQLKQLFQTTPNLIGVEKAIADSRAASIPAPAELQIAKQVAFSDLVPDSDGKLRRHLISLEKQNGEKQLSLGARLAIEYLAQQGTPPKVGNSNRSAIQLGQAILHPLQASDGGYAKADMGGYQILANFAPSPRRFKQVSLSDLLADQVPETLLRDRVILLGVTAPSLQNPFYTPTTRSPDEAWYGVELQADLASQMIAAARGERSLLRGVPMALNGLWIMLWAVGSAIAAHSLPSNRFSRLALPCGLLILVGASYIIFLQGWWIVVAAPSIAFLGAGLVSRRLSWQNIFKQSHHQLRLLEDNLDQKVAIRTQSLQAENRLLSQAKSRAEQANQSKSKFLARMSHELRVPLNSMLGFSRMMKADPDINANNRENLDIIYSSGEHLLTLINDVLDVSRIEANQLHLREQVINLSSLLKRLESMLKLQANEKGLRFRCSMDSRLPQYILGDETRLLQVLINLSGNAIKFTDVGHVILRAWTLDDSSAQLYFEVEDTGIGISASDAENVFEPFVQCDSSNPKLPGSGLGLFISRQIVRQMKGEITLWSQRGKGSKFRISLPLREAEPNSIVGAAQNSQSLAQEQLSYRILVVDDVAFNRKLLAKLLTDMGFEVREAQDGESAIYQWENWKPQLLMMDIFMPVMDGYKVAQHIRLQEANRSLPPTPIIAVTGSASVEEKTQALTSGFNGLVCKPFERQQLLNAISQALVPDLT